MMKRKLTALFYIVVIVALAGCSLALEDDFAGNDVFVGLSMRLDSIGMDEEASARREKAINDYLEGHGDTLEGDNWIDVDKNGDIVVTPMSGEKSFQLGEGDQYVVIDKRENEMGESAVSWQMSDCLGDVHQRFFSRVDGNECGVDCTLYFSSEDMHNEGSVIVYIDSVYRRPDGSLYVLRNDGGISGSIGGFSYSYSEAFSEVATDGTKSEEIIAIKVTLEVLPGLERAVLIEMDENDAVIARHALDLSGESGFTQAVSRDAAYVIIEEHAIDYSEGMPKEIVTHTALNFTDGMASHTIYIPQPEKWLKPVDLRVTRQP